MWLGLGGDGLAVKCHTLLAEGIEGCLAEASD